MNYKNWIRKFPLGVNFSSRQVLSVLALLGLKSVNENLYSSILHRRPFAFDGGALELINEGPVNTLSKIDTVIS